MCDSGFQNFATFFHCFCEINSSEQKSNSPHHGPVAVIFTLKMRKETASSDHFKGTVA